MRKKKLIIPFTVGAIALALGSSYLLFRDSNDIVEDTIIENSTESTENTGYVESTKANDKVDYYEFSSMYNVSDVIEDYEVEEKKGLIGPDIILSTDLECSDKISTSYEYPYKVNLNDYINKKELSKKEFTSLFDLNLYSIIKTKYTEDIDKDIMKTLYYFMSENYNDSILVREIFIGKNNDIYIIMYTEDKTVQVKIDINKEGIYLLSFESNNFYSSPNEVYEEMSPDE